MGPAARAADRIRGRAELRLLVPQEQRRKNRRDGFLAQIMTHSEDFRTFHRENRRAGHKLAKAVLQAGGGPLGPSTSCKFHDASPCYLFSRT